jgi:hypothetical protein
VFALRGGLLEGIHGAQQQLNPFGLVALAGFVGLFTRHAVETLRKVFDVVFDPRKEDANLKVRIRGVRTAPPRCKARGGCQLVEASDGRLLAESAVWSSAVVAG